MKKKINVVLVILLALALGLNLSFASEIASSRNVDNISEVIVNDKSNNGISERTTRVLTNSISRSEANDKYSSKTDKNDKEANNYYKDAGEAYTRQIGASKTSARISESRTSIAAKPNATTPKPNTGDTKPNPSSATGSEGSKNAPKPEVKTESKEVAKPIPKPELNPNIIQAKACVVINADNGDIIFSKNMNERLFPASTTKMLTALIVAENFELSAKISAPSNFKNPDPQGSNIAIDHNEEFTVDQLLHALLIASANDAAEVFAYNFPGGKDAFIAKMNERAQSLGLKNSHFTNAHGLHDNDHYTTVHDLAIIGTEVMKNPTLKPIVSKTEYIIPPTNKKKDARNYIKTTNWFLLDGGNTIEYNGSTIPVVDPNVIGIKTGYTPEAGNCLVSEIEKDNKRFISVVLGAPDKKALYTDSKIILYFALNNFKLSNIVSKEQVITSVDIPSMQTGKLDLLSSGKIVKTMPISYNPADLKVEINVVSPIPKVIDSDTVLGEAIYSYNGEVLGKVDLISAHGISEESFIGQLTVALSSQSPYQNYLKYLIPVGKVLLAFIIWRIIINARHRKRRAMNRAQILKR